MRENRLKENLQFLGKGEARKELLKELDIHTTTYSGYISGRNTMPLKRAIAISNAMRITLDDLVYGDLQNPNVANDPAQAYGSYLCMTAIFEGSDHLEEIRRIALPGIRPRKELQYIAQANNAGLSPLVKDSDLVVFYEIHEPINYAAAIIRTDEAVYFGKLRVDSDEELTLFHEDKTLPPTVLQRKEIRHMYRIVQALCRHNF
jgi:transcriptional regulator with XRE-family HTH domain